jgi:hypothetical protein
MHHAVSHGVMVTCRRQIGRNGLYGMVYTIYELHSGDLTRHTGVWLVRRVSPRAVVVTSLPLTSQSSKGWTQPF